MTRDQAQADRARVRQTAIDAVNPPEPVLMFGRWVQPSNLGRANPDNPPPPRDLPEDWVDPGPGPDIRP
jgi:hypothetical protein